MSARSNPNPAPEAEAADLRGLVAAGTPAKRRTRKVGRSRLAVLTLALALVLPAGIALAGGQTFSDVPPSHPFFGDIEAIADAGVTGGCTPTRYCPDDNVTREQMAAFMNRLGALSPGKTPVVNAAELDGNPSSAFARPLFAVVNADGTLARGAGVVSAAGILGSPGRYEVIFDRDVTACAYLATIGTAGTGTAATGTISTALLTGTTNGVFVRTIDDAGAFAERPFHLLVMCPGS